VTAEINRGYLEVIRGWSRPSAPGALRLAKRSLQVLAAPFVVLLGGILLVGLRGVLARRPASASQIHEDAIALVPEFVEQYPLHLYPVLAKSLELAYLKRRLPALVGHQASVLEVAIGEGTLSARVFGDRRVTGLDLNPHSLVHAARMPHVVRAIVGDGLAPPVSPGSFDVLLSLNFLHHVTEKVPTVARWARAAPVLMYNENTPFWASGWAVPYVLKRLGLGKLARRYADHIEKHSLQRLVDRRTLDAEIRAVAPITEEASFLSERSFFLSSLFSLFMLCYGPPTPPLVKRLFVGPLRRIALPLTTGIARALIRYDAYQDRTTDTFVFFVCQGAPVTDRTSVVFECPRCGSKLGGSRCAACGTVFPEVDGMLFLLPSAFAFVFEEYSRRVSDMPTEHL
jgi:predicted RNA-binding Zn-ribbon protein involved in translation (DUF1610 family)